MNWLLNTGTVFWSLSFWLWSLAVLALAFMLLRGYLLVSWLWHLPERMPKMKGSMILKHGDLGALNPPPKRLTAAQVAKMMIVLGGMLLAYDVGTHKNYSKEHEAWKSRSAQIQQLNDKWKADYAAWILKQENK